jgi:hypothetical protein
MFQRSIARCQLGLAAVFSNDEGIRRQCRTPTSTSEKVERTGVLCFGLIGRIDVNKIDKLRDLAETLQHRTYTTVLHGKAANNLERSKILPNGRQRRLCVLSKPDMDRAAAQRLNSNRSRTSVEVHKAAASDSWRQDIEQSFSQAIACRTGLKSTWSNKLTGAIRSCNYAHLSMV